MAGQSPPVRRRLIGYALRGYREHAGYALDDAAGLLECDRSKISRIENGVRAIRPKELRELLTEYGVPPAELDAMVSLSRQSRAQGWWTEYADILPEATADYLDVESLAAQIMIFETQVIPALLQTRDYARVIAEAGPAWQRDGQRDRAAEAAAARQRIVLDGGRQLSVVLGEGAVRQQVGGPGVMAAQLTYLAELASRHPAITVQVLPFSAGAHAGAGSVSYSALRFASAPALGVVFFQAPSGGVCLDSPDEVASCLRTFTGVRTAALTAEATADLLRESAEALRPPWD
jgi:transcriptional regulator with XRE-family HTH domain